MRALRPPKLGLSAERPAAVLLESERLPEGGTAPAATLFLVGAECPYSCVFCDLWRHTLDTPTPPGALTRQVRSGLEELAIEAPADTLLKLYNASNFFEPRAVPPEEDAELAALARPFRGTVVESHAKLLGDRALHFAEALDGQLEVAVGLETVHPEALLRLGKGLTLEDFDRAALWLYGHGLGLRSFVLVGAPFVPAAEALEWVVRSVEHAVEQGAAVVSLIPVRGGNGALEELARQGEWCPPELALLEDALDTCLSLPAVIQADLWDLESFSSCAACLPVRRARLARLNLTGRREPRLSCAACGSV